MISFLETMPMRRRGLMMALCGASFWGISGVAGEYVLQTCGFSAGWLVVTRMLFAGCVMLLFDAWQNGAHVFDVWRDRRDACELLWLGAIVMSGVQYSYFACIVASNAATSTVLQYLMPIILIAHASLTRRRLPRPAESISVFLAVAGTFLLVTHGNIDTLVLSETALFWGLFSAALAAVYTAQPRRLLRIFGAMRVVGWCMFIGAMALSTYAPPWAFVGTWSVSAAIAYAYILTFGTIVAFVCFTGSTKYIEPSETGVVGSVEPLSAILFSVLLLGTSFSLPDLLGMALILSSVLFLARM